MKMFDEVEFDYSANGFREIEQNGLNLAEMNVNKDGDFKKGKYRIVSCHNLFIDKTKAQKVENKICDYFLECIKFLKIKKSSTILFVGLGNGNILADSFGEKVCKKLLSTRLIKSKLFNYKTCSICPNVKANTGIETFDIVSGVAKSVKANLIILIDSLLTSNQKRLGHSFQISSVGMTPGGAILNNKEITFDTTNTPCISIGVPFMYDLKNNNNSDIIVTPKDIKVLVEKCADVLSSAINKITTNLTKDEIDELMFGL